MNTSILSRVLIGAICLAALAGWAGVQVEITAAGPVAVHAPLAPASEVVAVVETVADEIGPAGEVDAGNADFWRMGSANSTTPDGAPLVAAAGS